MDIKQNVEWLGIGQAGGNIANQAEGIYTVRYLNTSRSDLDTLENAKLIHHIKGGEGASKDRKKAQILLKGDIEAVKEMLDKSKAEIFILCFSTGGGTGSGIAPIIANYLSSRNKIVVCVTALPSVDESPQAKMNSVNCFQELESLKIGASFIIDNEKSIDKAYLNRQCFISINNLLSLTEYRHMKGNIDYSEIKKVLSQKGMATCIALSRYNMDENIQKLRNHKALATLENEKKLAYVVYSSREKEETKVSELTRAFGLAKDMFRCYIEECAFVGLFGLPFPYSVLDYYTEEIQENSNELKENAKKDKRLKQIALFDEDETQDDEEIDNSLNDFF